MPTLLSLPLELRTMIWGYVFTSSTGVVTIWPGGAEPGRYFIFAYSSKIHFEEQILLTLLAVCKRTNLECRHLLWTCNTINVDHVKVSLDKIQRPEWIVLKCVPRAITENARNIQMGMILAGSALPLKYNLEALYQWKRLKGIELLPTWRYPWEEALTNFNLASLLYHIASQNRLELSQQREHEYYHGYFGTIRVLLLAFHRGGFLAHLARKIIFQKKSPEYLTRSNTYKGNFGSPCIIFEEMSRAIQGEIWIGGRLVCLHGAMAWPLMLITRQFFPHQDTFLFVDDYYVWVAAQVYYEKTGREAREFAEFLWGQSTINIEPRILSEVQWAIQGLVDGFKHLYGKNVFAYAKKLESASPGMSVKTHQLRFLILGR